MKKYLKLVLSILLPFLAGAVGGLFTASSVSSGYATINKPFFTPPDWIFGPVWMILYLLMGIALYLVWVNKHNKKALIFFGIQLALNALWSILFFGIQNPLIAFVDIILLWVSIFITIMYFYKIKRLAAYLLVPYIIWVTFASILNFYIVILN